MLVLLTDPFPADQQWTVSALHQLGYTIMHAHTNDECIQLFATHPIHLVILEYAVAVPEDGIAVCQHIRARSELPIMFWSRYRFISCIVAGISAGADMYILKPMSQHEFQVRCAALLRRVYHVVHPILIPRDHPDAPSSTQDTEREEHSSPSTSDSC